VRLLASVGFETMEIVSLGLEDHSPRSQAALKSAIACSRLAA
jgi:hypothetical protein